MGQQKHKTKKIRQINLKKTTNTTLTKHKNMQE